MVSPETPDATTLASLLLISSPDVDPAPTSEVMSGLELTSMQNPEWLPDPLRAEDTSSYTPGILRVSPAYNPAMNPEELSHLNEMLDRIQSMSISDGKTSVHD